MEELMKQLQEYKAAEETTRYVVGVLVTIILSLIGALYKTSLAKLKEISTKTESNGKDISHVATKLEHTDGLVEGMIKTNENQWRIVSRTEGDVKALKERVSDLREDLRELKAS